MIRKAGFDGIFTGWSKDAPIGHWASIIRDQGMLYQSLHAPFGHVDQMWEAGEMGDEVADELCACLEDCARHQIPLMVAHAFIGFDKHTPGDIGVERFSWVARRAEQVGVKLALENTEGEEYLERLMCAFRGNPAVGFCIDTGHEMCYNRSKDMIGKYSGRVIATHFNDNVGITDENNITWLDDAHLLPFDGIADWKGIIRRLKKAGYEGSLTFELTSLNKPDRHTHDGYANWSFEEYLAQAYARAKRIQDLWTNTQAE